MSPGKIGKRTKMAKFIANLPAPKHRKAIKPLHAGNPQFPLLNQKKNTCSPNAGWKEQDTTAQHHIGTSHLQGSAAKIAMGYRCYACLSQK